MVLCALAEVLFDIDRGELARRCAPAKAVPASTATLACCGPLTTKGAALAGDAVVAGVHGCTAARLSFPLTAV